MFTGSLLMRPLLAAFERQAATVAARARPKGQPGPRRPEVAAGWQLPS